MRAVLLTAAFFLTGASLRADFITIAQPNAAYVHGTTLADFTDPDYTQIGYLTAGGETLRYDNLLEVHTVTGDPSTTTWDTWNNPPAVETSMPRVGYTQGSSELTISLSRPVSTFGVEIGINYDSVPQGISADFYSGSKLVGSVDLSENGPDSALLFAASTTTDPFTSIVINDTSDYGGLDFAIARQRFTLAADDVPEPSTFALLGGSLAFLAGFRRAARRRAVVR